MKESSGLKSKFRLGYIVFVVLVATKIVEYLVGTRLHGGALPYLAILALIAVWPILYFFMHINELRRPKE